MIAIKNIHATKLHKKSINAVFFSWVMAAYFSLVINFPLLLKVCLSTKENGVSWSNIFIPISILCLLMCLFVSLFSILSIKYIEKPIFISLTLLSSLLSYYYIYLGVMFNGSSPIIGAIEQTTWSELSSSITLSLVLWILIFGIIPAYFIYKTRLFHPPLWQEIAWKALGICLYPAFYLSTSLPSLPLYHSILCESGLAARTPFQIIPTNFSEDLFNRYKDRVISLFPYKKVGLDVKNNNLAKNGKKTLFVFVLGETARSMNFELNGYTRKTNPYTSKQNIISFQEFSACGTSTRVSVPCIFSSLGREDFHELLADHQDNLLDILKRADLNLLWIDNNGARDCQGVCKPIKTVLLNGLDGIIVSEFKKQLDDLKGKDTVIILHLHGSHGPDYYAKYPEKFRKFIPDCRRDDFRFCDQKALVNAYDNSILYTDYVLSQVIQILKKQEDVWNTVLMYTSDHGESIGENGIYEHCSPYMIAPKEQIKVPMLIWASSSIQKEKNISISCLKDKAQHGDFSHDNIFHSILGIMDIETSVYQDKLDLFNSCRL